jgi:murein DD-endopeptidase MepM/ murein hydrolase activator NlpD
LSQGDIYKTSTDKKTKRTEVRFFSNTSNIIHLFWRIGEREAGAENLPIKCVVKDGFYSGTVKGSLIESIARVAGDELIGYRFMDAYLLDYNIPKQLNRNAKFSFHVEKYFFEGKFLRFGQITSASLEILNQTVTRNFKTLNAGGIFTGTDIDYSSRPYYAPVDLIKISSLFQKHRFHPIRKFRKAHLGIDFEAQEGTPVYSVANGQVARTGRNRAAGRFIVIKHTNGVESFYNHLSTVAALTPGTNLVAGAKVGEIGCSGYCTKAHLHFALKKNGQFVNPINLVRGYSYSQSKEIFKLYAQRHTD